MKYNVININSVNDLMDYLKKKNLIKSLPKDVKRHFVLQPKLEELIVNAKKIAMFTDYDKDGIGSAFNLNLGVAGILRKHNYNTAYSIDLPLRSDGYGPNLKWFKGKIDELCDTFIFADCGTNSENIFSEARKYAKETYDMDITIIVLDHHKSNTGIFPNVELFINPLYSESDCECKEMCATALTFLLLRDYMTKDEQIYSMCITGIATCADAMPREGENRFFIQWAIKAIKSNRMHPSIRCVLLQNDVDLQEIDLSTFQFTVVPLFNAAGRVESAKTAYDFLNSTNCDDLLKSYKKLSYLNELRKNRTAYLNSLLHPEENCVNVCWTNDTTYDLKGIAGLGASDVVKKTGYPAIVFVKKDGKYTGSARSVEGFDINSAVSDFLANDPDCLAYGGHAGAMGISFSTEAGLKRFKEFCKTIVVPENNTTTDVLDFKGITPEYAIEIMNQNGIFDAERPLMYIPEEISGVQELAGNKHSMIYTTTGKALCFFFQPKNLGYIGKKNIVVELSGVNKISYFIRDIY